MKDLGAHASWQCTMGDGGRKFRGPAINNENNTETLVRLVTERRAVARQAKVTLLGLFFSVGHFQSEKLVSLDYSNVVYKTSPYLKNFVSIR